MYISIEAGQSRKSFHSRSSFDIGRRGNQPFGHFGATKLWLMLQPDNINWGGVIKYIRHRPWTCDFLCVVFPNMILISMCIEFYARIISFALEQWHGNQCDNQLRISSPGSYAKLTRMLQNMKHKIVIVTSENVNHGELNRSVASAFSFRNLKK